MVTRRLGVGRGVYYIVAQLVGATVAALGLKVLFAPAAAAAVNLGTPAVGVGVGTGAAVLAEIIMTFFLMYSVFGVAVDQRGAKAIAGLVIGLTITMDIFVGGGLTGAAMNPARWFGPAVVQGAFDNWWIYWVGPIYRRKYRGRPVESVLSIGRIHIAATCRQHGNRADRERADGSAPHGGIKPLVTSRRRPGITCAAGPAHRSFCGEIHSTNVL
jgi:hypothetical protein